MIDMRKSNLDPANPGEEMAELQTPNGAPLAKLEVSLSWEVPQEANRTGGRLGGFLAKVSSGAKATDVDANGIIFVNEEAVDFVGPNHLNALGGLARHSGNVIKGAGDDNPERIFLDLAEIAQREPDITAVAFVASCFTGNFNNVTGAKVRFSDVSYGTPQPAIKPVRFSITGGHNAALVSVVVKSNGGWVVRTAKSYGQARDWRGLAGVARNYVTLPD